MNLFRDLDELPERFRHGSLSIGNFDGVHRGHVRIIERLLAVARQVRGPAVVFTFDPHPAQILRPDQAPAPLGWTERKAELLGQLGADALVAYPTDQAFLRLGAPQFFRQIVCDRLHARAMVEGSNFLFGHNRTGTIKMLRQLCDARGMALHVVEPVQVDGMIVSSSRVREAIASGRVELARSMLGRPHRIRGTVIPGAARGARLGYPTANLGGIHTLLPGGGIYAGRAWVQGTSWPAALSVGPNPTFGEETWKVEAHLIGYRGSLYDRPIEVDFLERLRDIERFETAEQLTAQMDRDVAATGEIVEKLHHPERGNERESEI